MADDFNPYQLWLGLPPTAGPPDHYTLLGLEQREVDPHQVRRAADVRKSRVRSCRPGDRAVAWSRLLDEVEQAQRCLSDPAQKAQYDAHLRATEPEPPTADPQPAAVQNLMPPVWPLEPPAAPALRPEAPLPPTVSALASTTRLATPITGSALATCAESLPQERVCEIAADAPKEPAERTPFLQGLSPDFVVPTAACLGAAAQLLPPPVATSLASNASAAVAMSVMSSSPLAPASTGEWSSPAFGSEPRQAPATPNLTQPATLVSQRSSPWTPGALISVAGIGLAIVMLAGAIILVWRTRQDETARLTIETGVTTTGSTPHAAERKTPPPAMEPETVPGLPKTPRVQPEPEPPHTPAPQPKPPITDPVPPARLPVVPKPTPQPAPPVVPTPEQIQQVQTALKKARQLLAERDPAAAQAAVKEAQQLAGDSPLRETVAPTEALTHFVNEFWSAVGAALPKLAGSEIEVGDTRVFVIETGRDRILIRWAGRNREFTRQTMPAGLARKIAENWLAKNPTSKVIVGAFLAVDPTMLANSGREKARALWTEAAAGGADVEELLKTLSEL